MFHSVSPLFRRGLVPGALLTLALSSGCGDDLRTETVSLSGLADRELTFTLNDVDAVDRLDAAGAHRFTITFSLAGGEVCSRLADGVTATFNGEPMHLEQGGLDTTAGRDLCVPTRAWYDFDPNEWEQAATENATVRLQSGDESITLTVQNGKAKRRFAYQGTGSPERLQRGRTYTYLWKPESETPGPVLVTLLREEGRDAATLPSTQEGGSVSFPIAEGTPPANHLLTLGASLPGVVLACEGVSRCSGTLTHAEDFVVTIVP